MRTGEQLTISFPEHLWSGSYRPLVPSILCSGPVARRSAILFSVNDATLKELIRELAVDLADARFGRVFLLGRNSLAIDLRLRDGRFLFISADPRSPRLYLIRRKMKELEKTSRQETSFAASLRKSLAGAEAVSVSKLEEDRVVNIRFRRFSELEGEAEGSLVIQLTGRSANVFLLDGDGRITDSLKPGSGAGQEAGEKYLPPERPAGVTSKDNVFDSSGYDSMSEALDEHFLKLDAETRFRQAFKNSESRLKGELRKLTRLRKALENDLRSHGDREKWKKYGDLLLANAAAAERDGGEFVVTDYFTEDAPEIRIPADPRHSVSEAAERYFRKYSKARNAEQAINQRLAEVRSEEAVVEEKLKDLREAFERRDENSIIELSPPKQAEPEKKRADKKQKEYSGVRRFRSRDGFEILVGKKSKDNDHLTFRIAGSLDTWMHAADYPGSHVVIRNPGRKEIPPGTLNDAARLAAFYSKARGESKAAVHYTLKKFVHKPKGARPGLVSLADFKTLMVEPGVPDPSG